MYLNSINPQERIQRPSNIYFRGANAAFLIFDLTDDYSFSRLDFWLKEILEKSKDICIFLIGTKSDLTCKIPEDKITQFTVENQLEFFRVSSKTGENVHASLNQCLNQMIEKNKEKFGKDFVEVPTQILQKEMDSYCLVL
jgi:GTPase SAR1 family protein